MTIKEINTIYDKIVCALDEKKLKDAFDFLLRLIVGTNAYAYQDRWEELQDTYKSMLRYCIEGVKDPMQEQIYRNVIVSAYNLADQLKHLALAEISDISYYGHRRMLRQVDGGESYDAIHKCLSGAVQSKRMALTKEENVYREQREIEFYTDRLFEKIWTSGLLSTDEVVQIREIMYDRELPFTVGCLLVSALTLGLESAFDIEKLNILFEAAALEEEKIRCRALVGVFLVLYIYRKRIELYPEVADGLATLSDRFPDFQQAVRAMTFRFILALETEKVTRKLQDEIIPDMVKISQKLHLKGIDLEHLGEEMNPEWKDVLSNGDLERRIMEFSKMQEEGVDVMHSSFIHLKSFPFFRELSHWFFPFTSDYSALVGSRVEESVEWEGLDNLADASFLCDSDKYSICFSIIGLPEQARRMILSQFGGHASELIQEVKDRRLSERRKDEILFMQYIQDLYRFHKLYPRHGDFKDIFECSLEFFRVSFLRPYYYKDKETLETLAECYLRKSRFRPALSLYERMAEMDPTDAVLFQKIGYCDQMMGDNAEALKAYLHSDIQQPDNKWVLRHIGSCYRSLGHPEKALPYYERCEKLDPDDLSIQTHVGHCYLEMADYGQALKHFFKVEYLDSENVRVWRAIAWCSLLTGKLEQAHDYYQKILRLRPTAQDFLNAGHTELIRHNLREAVDFYKQAIEKDAWTFPKFEEQFDADMLDLSKMGIERNENEILLLMDQLRYLL